MLSNNMKKILRNVIPLPQRWILAIMGFLAILNAYTMRICLSVAIVDMVKRSNRTSDDPSDYCPIHEGQADAVKDRGEYEWSEEMQGIILSSFYWGYVITHIPGGILSEKFGGKYILSLGIFSTAIFTLITPWAIDMGGSTALIIVRFLEGLGEGTTFPALGALLARWVPLSERSKLGSFVFGGGQVGTILGVLLSGLLIDYFNDWRFVFYFFGLLGLLWFCFFTIMCYSDPGSHPYISEEEKELLKKEIGQLARDPNLPKTPWKLILTNVAMIALVCAQIGHDFGFYIMVTDLPKYMSDVLNFSIKENGIYSAVPYALMWFISVSTGVLGDWLLKKKYVGLTMARKLFTTIASVFPAILIVGASYAGCDRLIVVILFTLAMGTMGTYYPGMKVNPLDLSPNYAGTLMAITNGIGAITGIIGPYLVGVMTTNSSLTEWRTVFWITFVIFMVTNLIYVMYASGEVQSFNNQIQDINTAENAEAPPERFWNRIFNYFF